MHVVHRQHDRPTISAALQMLSEHSQQVHSIDFVQAIGEKLGQRTEGQWLHRFRRGYPFEVVAMRRMQHLVYQSRFSDTRLPRYQALRIGPGLR